MIEKEEKPGDGSGGIRVDARVRAMTGPEIHRALHDLMWERTREMQRRMKDYDETVDRPARLALIEQCPHEDNDNWENNGVGWAWTSCRWCGKRMRQESMWGQEP